LLEAAGKEEAMTKWFALLMVLVSAITGGAYAQYPVMDAVAQKVIGKYQSATCGTTVATARSAQADRRAARRRILA
jgi:hypothetical protein